MRPGGTATPPDRRSEVAARLRAAGCVFAEDEARMLITAASTADELEAMVSRRATGVPLEQVVGWAEFCGLRIRVEPGVFVPRRRTELLVREAGALARHHAGEVVVVDLCCGSGAVGAALLSSVDGITLHAVDIDPVAVRCARRNLAATGAQVHLGDLFEPLPAALQGGVDLLVVNAPYVPSDELRLLPAEARVYEPPVALDGGADGLDLHRRVAAGGPRWLAPGGSLLLETSAHQTAGTVEAVAASGLIPRVIRSRRLEATVVVGTRPVNPRWAMTDGSTPGTLPAASHPTRPPPATGARRPPAQR